MNDVRLGRILRALRRRLGLTQAQVGGRSGVSQSTVSLVERGHLDRLALGTLRRLFAAVEARFDGEVTWRGGAIDRLLDEHHAALVEHVVTDLTDAGWEVLVEVSFNHYGDRGSIDVLAAHREAAAGLVVEVKSDVTAVDETNRRMDVKMRLAPALIEERFGFRPAVLGRLLVLPRSTTSFRRIKRHAATFRSVLPGSTIDARRWIRSPVGRFAGIAFVPVANRRGRRGTVRGERNNWLRDSPPRVDASAPASNHDDRWRGRKPDDAFPRAADHGGS